jgi:hypothetical protein
MIKVSRLCLRCRRYRSSPCRRTHAQAGKKGATDEERLMILKMLQDGKITVDEAETLFKAMES